MELEALQEAHSEIRALGAQIVAITPELERYTRLVHRKSNLAFDILSDPHLKTIEQFGLTYVLPDYLRELYKNIALTLDKFNDESEYRLPMPARFIIDSSGIIRSADVNADYTIRPEPAETVRKLSELAKAK